MKVFKAINYVTAELAKIGLEKGQKNAQQGYAFRGIDDVYNVLSKLLAANSLCVLPRVLERNVVERQTRNGSVLFYVTLKVDYDLISSEDDSKHTITVFGEAMDSGDKATNKAMSAAYKYACLQAFCIPTIGDNDADATTHEVKASDTLMAHNDAVRQNMETIQEIKSAIQNDDPTYTAQLWYEISDDIKKALWLAPSKGGVFTTAERAYLKSDAVAAARNEITGRAA